MPQGAECRGYQFLITLVSLSSVFLIQFAVSTRSPVLLFPGLLLLFDRGLVTLVPLGRVVSGVFFTLLLLLPSLGVLSVRHWENRALLGTTGPHGSHVNTKQSRVRPCVTYPMEENDIPRYGAPYVRLYAPANIV